MAKPPRIDWGTCHADDCDEPLPADMIAVLVGGDGYCSPDCGRSSNPDVDAEVWLHDPQLTVDRAELDLHCSTVQLLPPATGEAAISLIDGLVDVRWRV